MQYDSGCSIAGGGQIGIFQSIFLVLSFNLCFFAYLRDTDSGEDTQESYQLVMIDPRQKSGSERQLLIKDPMHTTDDPSNQIGNYDEALEKTGFGKFHVFLVILCGWANASDAVEILSVSFLLPAAEKDLELTPYRKGVLSAIIFVGMLVGGYLWGVLADINGRRRTLLLSLTTNAAFGLMSSFAQVYWLFLLMRFMSGVGVGGSIPVIFSYCGEFQPKERRGMMISIVALFWMTGNIVAASLALAVIPSGIGFVNPGGFSYNSWRIFVALCTLPALTSAFTFFFMPESPKFLLENGETSKAREVLQIVYSWNKWDKKANYPVKTLIPSSNARKLSVNHAGSRSCADRIAEARRNAGISLQMTAQLFMKPLTWVTVPLLVVIWTVSFGYYGLWMWMPQLFSQTETGNGSVCSVDPGEVNSTQPQNDRIYQDALYTSVSNLPGNLVTIFLVDVLGRKFLLSTSLILSGVIVFFIWFVSTRLEVLIVFCFFGGVSVVAWNVLSVMSVEIYPTHMRTTALGVQGIVNRLASITSNLIFGLLIQTHCAVNILLVAGLLAFGGLTAYYGLWMWMPQLFSQTETGNGSVCSVDPGEVNSTQPQNDRIYQDALYTSVSNLPGNLVTIFLVDVLGRKFLLSTSLILSGVIVFFIWFVSTRLEVLIVFCFFGGVSVVAWNVLSVMSVEIYPTHMRTTALGVQGIVNRLASITSNLIFGLLIQTHCAVNILLVAGLLAFGGLTAYVLPRTKKVSLK